MTSPIGVISLIFTADILLNLLFCFQLFALRLLLQHRKLKDNFLIKAQICLNLLKYLSNNVIGKSKKTSRSAFSY